jgi:hypothetical protein
MKILDVFPEQTSSAINIIFFFFFENLLIFSRIIQKNFRS